MILQFEGEEEETRPSSSRTQPIPADSTPAAPATQLVPATVGDEEEKIAILIEELDRYFISPSASLAYSPISKHLEIVQEHLSGTSSMNPTVSTQL